MPIIYKIDTMLIRIIILAFLNLFLSGLCTAQNQVTIDSLLNLLQNERDNIIKINTLNELAWEYRKYDYQKSIQFAKEALRLSKLAKYQEGEGTSYNRIGNIYETQLDYTSAIASYKQALTVDSLSGNEHGKARAYYQISNVYKRKHNYIEALGYAQKSAVILKNLEEKKQDYTKVINFIGDIYKSLNDYEKAIQFYTNSLEMRIEMNDTEGIANTYLSMGKLYEEQGLYQKALEVSQKSLSYWEKLKDRLGKSFLFNNIGNIYHHLEKFDSARAYYFKSAGIKEDFGYLRGLITTYNNIGLTYVSLGHLDSALMYYQKSLSLNQKNIDNKLELAYSYYGLGMIASFHANYLDAEENYLEGLAYAEDIGSIQNILELSKGLAEIYEKQRNYILAFQYLSKYNNYQEKFERNSKRAIQLEAKYQEEKQNNKLLLAEIRQKRIAIYGAIIAFVLIFILLISILRGNKQKQRALLAEKKEKQHQEKIDVMLQEQELRQIDTMFEVQEQERKRIAKDLHDRLGSMLTMVRFNFQTIGSRIDNLKKQYKEQYKQTSELLDKACNQVREIAHDMTSGELMNFGLVKALEELCKVAENAGQLTIELLTFNLDERLNISKERVLYKIVQELLGNILKHAQAREVTIQLNRINGHLNLIVEDDGIGFNREDEHFKPGMGLKNVESRVKLLNGIVNIDSGKGNGTTISIDIPI